MPVAESEGTATNEDDKTILVELHVPTPPPSFCQPRFHPSHVSDTVCLEKCIASNAWINYIAHNVTSEFATYGHVAGVEGLRKINCHTPPSRCCDMTVWPPPPLISLLSILFYFHSAGSMSPSQLHLFWKWGCSGCGPGSCPHKPWTCGSNLETSAHCWKNAAMWTESVTACVFMCLLLRLKKSGET